MSLSLRRLMLGKPRGFTIQNGRLIQIEDLFVPPASLVQNADASSVPQSTTTTPYKGRQGQSPSGPFSFVNQGLRYRFGHSRPLSAHADQLPQVAIAQICPLATSSASTARMCFTRLLESLEICS